MALGAGTSSDGRGGACGAAGARAAGTRAAGPSPARLEQVRAQLREALGEGAELVSLRADGEQRLRGLAVSSGRLLSFVIHAQEQRLRTRPLLALLCRSRQA
ncbi:MAG: hypothetical protein ACKO0M_15155 [Cyanobium sp.]